MAEAPLFPELHRRLRAEQEAQSCSRGQAAASPLLGSYPLIFLAAQGSHFLHPRMPAPEGPQRSQSPTPLDKWGQWSPERHRACSRSDREPVGKSGPVSRQQCWPRAPSPQCSSCVPSLSGKRAGRVCSFLSLCCGGSISCQSPVSSKALEWGGGGGEGGPGQNILGSGSLNHKDDFIL